MQRFEEPVQNLRGDVIALATMLVVVAGTNTPATIFSDAAGQQVITSPRTDQLGVFAFYAPNGRYDIYVIINGQRVAHKTDVQFYDATIDAPLTQRQAADPAGASKVGYGLRTVSDKLSELAISAKDAPFNAKCDGVTDDTAAISSLISYLATHGGTGVIPGRTLISNIDLTLTGNKPFALLGLGIGGTALINGAPANNMLTLREASNVMLGNLSVDGGSSTPGATSGGAGLVWVNCNWCAAFDIEVTRVARIAFMAYNDHQTDTTKVYRGMRFLCCRVDGTATYSAGVGPSAFIVADYNDSAIEDCYIKACGLYGYEFKNDSSNNLIAGCVADGCYDAYYFGGDGAHTELGYVKKSVIANCSAVNCYNPLFLDRAWNNSVRALNIDCGGAPGGTAIIQMRNSCANNTVSGVDVTGRTGALFDMRATVTNSVIEFSNITDGAYSGSGGTVDSTCSGNRILFGTRDSSQTLIPATIYNNTFIDSALNREHFNIAASTIKKFKLGDVGSDSTFTTAKGFAFLGDTCDTFIATKQDYQFQYVGNFTTPDIFFVRHQFSTGERRFYEKVGATQTYTVWNATAIYPGADGGKSWGIASNRWAHGHVQNLHQYPPSSNTPTTNGELTVEATSNTQLTFRLKGLDGVVRSASLMLS